MHLSRRALLAAGAAGWLARPADARDAVYPPPVREAMLPAPGGRVYVRVNGDLRGPRAPLVLIHGGPGGTHTSLLDALALADERAVILYDQLDSGRSDWPQDPANWRVARFVDELEAIRVGLGVPRWHACGMSWGGTIALEYAARRPAALASVVLGGPLIATRAWLADADALRAALPADARATLVACEGKTPPSVAACDRATDVFYRHYNRREDTPAAMRDAARAIGNRGVDQRLYETMWGRSEFVATGTLRDYDGTALLARLDGARTLFMVGQYDEARPVTALGFAARVPGGAEVAVVPGAAHATLSDRPVETVGILRGWLTRHDTPDL
jgi:proline iminopeptidase/L-proline amide hydrolase